MQSIRTLLSLAATALFCAPVFAMPMFDVDFDGPLPAGTQLFGSAQVVATGGNPDTGGYLSLTDAANGQRGSIIFSEIAGSLTDFKIETDVRMGAGTVRPADGFSVNLVRPGDPVLADGLNGWATSPNGAGANQPEEGATTGLAIGFDEWDSGTPDVVGISVRVDNVLVSQISLPTLNGTLGDATSLQTGPNGQGLAGLGWAPLSIMFAADQTLSISYKSTSLFNQIINMAPITDGQLVIGSRTGGANSNHHLDNLSFMGNIESKVSEPPILMLSLIAAMGFGLRTFRKRSTTCRSR